MYISPEIRGDTVLNLES